MPVFITFRVHGLLHYWHRLIGVNVRAVGSSVSNRAHVGARRPSFRQLHISKVRDTRNWPMQFWSDIILLRFNECLAARYLRPVTEAFRRLERIRFLRARRNAPM